MKYLEQIRVDERLIHGQVLIKWLDLQKNCNEIVIVDGVIAENPILRSIMEKSLPKEYHLEIYSVLDDDQYLETFEKKNNSLILVRNLITLQKIWEKNIKVNKINIARLPFKNGKEKIWENIYMSGEEKLFLKTVLESGSEVYVQIVPDSEKIMIKDVL